VSKSGKEPPFFLGAWFIMPKLKGGGGGRSRAGGRGREVMKHNFLKLKGDGGGSNRASWCEEGGMKHHHPEDFNVFS